MGFEHYGTDTNWSAQQKAADQERQTDSEREYTNVKFKFNVGLTKLRVMPRYSGEEGKGWMVETYEHFLGKGVEPVVCPRMYELPCPFCERRQELYDAGEEKAAKDLKANHKYWVNAIILQEPAPKKGRALTPADGIYAVKVPAKIRNFLIDMDVDFAADYGDITDLEAGFNVFIWRDAVDSLDMYHPKLQRSRTSIVQELHEMGFDINNEDPAKPVFKLVNLDELVQIKPYDELKALLENGADEPVEAPVAPPVKLGVTSPKAVVAPKDATFSETPQAAPVMKITNPKPVPNIPRPPVVRRPGAE